MLKRKNYQSDDRKHVIRLCTKAASDGGSIKVLKIICADFEKNLQNQWLKIT